MLLFGKTKIAQEFDKKSIKNGIPSIILMENAAFSLFEEVKKILQKNKFDKIVLFAGSGGNGGDGFALLRQLTNRGINIPNFIVKLFDESKFTEETKINFKMLPKSIKFISMEKITGKILFIDGMIGTGLSRNLSEKYLNAVKFINNYQKSQKQVLAIDVPTGLNSDNGKEMPLSIVANLTVSMGILKNVTGEYEPEEIDDGEVEPERMPMASLLKERWQAWIKCGVLCSEMEAAALYVIARTLGIRAGGLMVAHGVDDSLEILCKTAVEGVRQLIHLDQS